MFNQEHEVKIGCKLPSDKWPFECSSIPGGGEGENKMKEISSSVESFSPLLGKNVKFKMKESTSSTAAFFKESES